MRIAALGRTHWLYDAIQALAARGHPIVAIGTSPASPEYQRTEADFRQLAEALGCPFFCDTSLVRQSELLARCKADVAVSVNWVGLVPEAVFRLFEHGVINAHLGDLPRFRGNAAPNWALLAGEQRVVATLHQMDAGLDSGPVLLQRGFPLAADTYVGDIYRAASEALPQMFVEAIAGLEAGTLQPRPQSANAEASLRCLPRHPEDGELDWHEPASRLGALVRASAEPFAGAYSFLPSPSGYQKLIVWRAFAEALAYPCLGVPGQVIGRDPTSGRVAVLTGEGALVLEEVEVQPGGRGTPTSLIPSARARLGLRPQTELHRLREELATLRQELKELRERSGG